MERYIKEARKTRKCLIWPSSPKPQCKVFLLYMLYGYKKYMLIKKNELYQEILTLWRRHTVLLNIGTRNICLLQHLWHLGSDLVRLTL